MEFLLLIWISLCILAAIVISVLGLAGLICAIVLPDVGWDKLEAFSGFVFCTLFAGLFYIHVWYLVAKPQESPELPATRNIHLTVPKDSSVNTQIISTNNTVNITDL